MGVESTWAELGAGVDHAAAESYREIDRQLRRIAKRKAGLEIEEARWLREAERQQIWRKLGFSTALEYLEIVFGYSPRTAMDRLRVAKELAELPALEEAVRTGELPYSAARELTRVMTRETEAAWLARAQGRNLRDIEELVAGRKRGDSPDTPKDPGLIKRRRVMELSQRVDALFEQCRSVLANELGAHVDDEVLLETLCRCFFSEHTDGAALESAVAATGAGRTTLAEEASTTRPRARAPRPAHRIVIYKCDECSRALQQGRGRMVQLSASELALAECDAEVVHTGSTAMSSARCGCAVTTLHGTGGEKHPPQRPTPTIPQRIRNQVWARDQGRCRVPGCRATRNLDVHHIVHRSEGGDHDPGNLTVLCSGHHKLHHDGLLEITGRAPDGLSFVRDGKRLVDARSSSESLAVESLRESVTSNKLATVIVLEDAKQALVTLGFKKRDAREALERASAHVGTHADVPTLVRAVLGGTRSATAPADEDPIRLARQALVQLGFSAPVAARAVDLGSAHVGTVELPLLIKEALRHCR